MAASDADGLMARLGELLDKFQGAGNDDDGDGKTVPYARFAQVNARAKAATEALAAMKAEVAALQEGHEAAVKALKEETSTQVAALAQRQTEDMALYDAGLDADGRIALRAAWERQPKAERGKSPVEWWTAQVGAYSEHSADPEKPSPKIPKTLAAYLPQPEEPSKGDTTRQSSGIGGVTIGVQRGVVHGADRKSDAEKIRDAKPEEFFDLLRGLTPAE